MTLCQAGRKIIRDDLQWKLPCTHPGVVALTIHGDERAIGPGNAEVMMICALHTGLLDDEGLLD